MKKIKLNSFDRRFKKEHKKEINKINRQFKELIQDKEIKKLLNKKRSDRDDIRG